MMKRFIFIVVILFFSPIALLAQNAAEILVFSVEGEVMIKRGKNIMPCKRAEKIIAGDIIQVKKGTVSLVNRALKRVTLEKRGSYSYPQIQTEFDYANASLANRFLVQVLDKMTHKTEQVAVAGGVVRGRRGLTQPVDSAVILSDLIRFGFSNPRKQKLTFFLLDEEHHDLFSKQTTDSLLVIKKQTATWWKPGAYFWEAAAPGKDGDSETIFFIPDDDKRAALLAEYDKLKKSFAGFSLKIRRELMNEVLRENRWVVD